MYHCKQPVRSALPYFPSIIFSTMLSIKKTLGISLVLLLAGQSFSLAQNKFNIGFGMPFYFGSARFGDLMQYANERQNYSGDDALAFRPAARGYSIWTELEFNRQWSFDIYWQRYNHKTNFGKSRIDNGAKVQYRIRHSLFSVGASRIALRVKEQELWLFAALSGGSRTFAYRNEGGSFSKERTANGRLFIAHGEVPIYFQLGLTPKIALGKTFFVATRVGYEFELMRGDAKRFHGGLTELVQPSYHAVNNNTNKAYVDLDQKGMNRFFIELRAGWRLGK